MKTTVARALAALWGFAAVTGVAFGQAEPPKPPAIMDMGSPMIIVYYLIAFVGLAICVALAAFPGRRSFED